MVGIDISTRSIKVVRLSNTEPQRYVSHFIAEFPEGLMQNGIVENVSGVMKILKKALDSCGVSEKGGEPLVFSVPETQSFLRVLEIPRMQEDEVGEAIKWEVAQHIPVGVENMYIDWQPIGDGGHSASSTKQEIQVGAAQRKIVDSLYGMLKPLPYDVAAFELESQAIVRALISKELQAKQGIIIIDLGHTGTNVVIHDHGAMRFTATLERGLFQVISGLTAEEQSLLPTFKSLPKEQQDAISAKMGPVTEELAVEVGSIAEFYSSIDSEHVVREIVLTGGGTNLPTLDQAFLKHFDDVHIQRGNPWVNVVTNHETHRLPVDLNDSARFSTAIGLAMRPVVL